MYKQLIMTYHYIIVNVQPHLECKGHAPDAFSRGAHAVKQVQIQPDGSTFFLHNLFLYINVSKMS